jgi:LmbE family N-acetylglucosaminyl deacetylase
VPYAEALAAGTAYEGRWLERDLRQIIERVQPTRVLAPSPLDLHPDHAAVGELVRRLMSARAASPSVLYWIVHGGHRWPVPRRYAPTALLQPPLHARALGWSSWPLTPTERDTKLAALRLYASQWEIMRPFMAAFARGNELFTADAAAQ